MAQVLIKNLNVKDKLSLDLTVDDITIRETLGPGQSVNIGGKLTIDDLNRNDLIRSLISSGKISVSSEAEGSDVAEELKSLQSTILGAPILATTDHIVASATISDGTKTLANQPDTPRNITITLTDVDNSVTANILVTGKDTNLNVVTEVMNPDGAGGGKSLVGTKIFAVVDSVVVSNTAGELAGDNLEVGVGNLVGLPTPIDATAAVKHVYLGGVRLASPTVTTGKSTSGVNASAGTYDGTKLLHVIYNVGE